MLRPFTRDDFDEFRSWFDDPLLEEALGPLDNAWLEAVLSESPPAEFCWIVGGELRAVVGIARPTSPHQPWVITDLAVRPSTRGEGHGREVLAAVMQLADQSTVADSPRWLAYVMIDNFQAQRFFTRIGWRVRPNPDQGMLCFECPPADALD